MLEDVALSAKRGPVFKKTLPDYRHGRHGFTWSDR